MKVYEYVTTVKLVLSNHLWAKKSGLCSFNWAKIYVMAAIGT